MSEDQSQVTESAEQSGPDLTQKFSDLESNNAKLAQQGEELNQKLNSIMQHLNESAQKQAVPAVQQDLEDLKYTDPDKYLEVKLQDVEKRVESKIQAQQQEQSKRAQVLQSLVSDYPELNEADSDLHKRAVEINSQLDSKQRDTAAGYQLAVLQAAQELGVVSNKHRTKSKPTQQAASMEEFIGGGSSSNKSEDNKPKGDKLDPKTIEFAARCGLDVNDPKVRERLAKRAERKNWGRYK